MFCSGEGAGHLLEHGGEEGEGLGVEVGVEVGRRGGEFGGSEAEVVLLIFDLNDGVGGFGHKSIIGSKWGVGFKLVLVYKREQSNWPWHICHAVFALLILLISNSPPYTHNAYTLTTHTRYSNICPADNIDIDIDFVWCSKEGDAGWSYI